MALSLVEIEDVGALAAAAVKVGGEVRAKVQAAKDAKSDGGAKVTIAEAEAIVKIALSTLEAPVLALVKDLVG